MFAQAGLDVEMADTSNGSAATQAMIGGTYQIAKSDLMSICEAHLHGIAIVLVAPENMYNPRDPFALLQVADDAPYRTGADLNGKTAGVASLHGGGSLMVKAWVDKNGGDWRSLTFVEVPNPAMEAAIVQHRVAAGVLQPPQLDASLAAGTTRTLGDCMGAIAPHYLFAAYIARRDWASTHADEVRRFASVLAEATTYVNSHPAETAPLVAELAKMSLDKVKLMHRALNGTVLDGALVQPFIDAAARYGEIERTFPAREILWNG